VRQTTPIVEILEIGGDELERLLAVRNAVWPRDPASAEEYVDWRRQAEDAVWLLAVEDGVDVGAGVGVHGWHSPPGVGRLELWVAAAARGRGTGTALLERLGAWLASRGCSEATAAIVDGDEASAAWAGRRGFVEVGRNSVLALDLADHVRPEVDAPEGIEIVRWAERPELAPGLYRVYVEAVPDIPGEEETELPAYEDWLENDMRGVSDRPEATFVALADGDVIGYAKLAIPPGAADVAWHDLTGVLRAWRGRGVAGALKRAQIAWAAEHGFRWLKTANEERNEPVRRLNARHGYRLQPGVVTVRGPVRLEGTAS